MKACVSRYRNLDEERLRAINILQAFTGKPYVGREEEWAAFMAKIIRLPLCHLEGVRRALDEGIWRRKMCPVLFIRKTVPIADHKLFAIPPAEPRKSRAKAHVGRSGRAIDPDQKRPLTLEESLRFNKPLRRKGAYVGSIASLSLPDSILFAINDRGQRERSSPHGIECQAIDYFNSLHDERGGWADDVEECGYQISPSVLLNPDEGYDPSEDCYEQDRAAVDWSKVADRWKLNDDERFVLDCKLRGVSRDVAMATQKSDSGRRRVQAAWKRLDRKWHTLREVIEYRPKEKIEAQRMTHSTAASALQETNRRQQARHASGSWSSQRNTRPQMNRSIFDGELLNLNGEPLLRVGRRVPLQELEDYVIRLAKYDHGGRWLWQFVAGLTHHLRTASDEELIEEVREDRTIDDAEMELLDLSAIASRARDLIRRAIFQYDRFILWRKNPLNPRPEWF
jgi:hypothetical protein